MEVLVAVDFFHVKKDTLVDLKSPIYGKTKALHNLRRNKS